MNEHTKELIAIGASISAHCQPCLTHHVNKAKELGISDDQIDAAMDVGHMIEKGAMAAMRDFAKGVVDQPASNGSKSCCG